VEHKIIKKSGAWYSYGDDRIGQGRDNVRQFLKDNPEMADEIEKKIRAKLMPKPEEKKAEDKKPEDAPAPTAAEEATEE